MSNLVSAPSPYPATIRKTTVMRIVETLFWQYSWYDPVTCNTNIYLPP